MTGVRGTVKLNPAQWLLKGAIQRQERQFSVRGGSLGCGQRRLQTSFNLTRYRSFAKDQQYAIGKKIGHGLTTAHMLERHYQQLNKVRFSSFAKCDHPKNRLRTVEAGIDQQQLTTVFKQLDGNLIGLVNDWDKNA